MLFSLSIQLRSIMNPDCSRLGLIKTSLDSTEKTWEGYVKFSAVYGMQVSRINCALTFLLEHKVLIQKLHEF